MNKKLTWDAENMETVAIETANDREMRYIYAMAVALLHILDWIRRNDERSPVTDNSRTDNVDKRQMTWEDYK